MYVNLYSKDLETQNLISTSNDRIDYILVYNKYDEEFKEIRNFYEKNLEKLNLKLEKCEWGVRIFVKIYVPKSILKQYCKIMKMKMPVRKEIVNQLANDIDKNQRSNWFPNCIFYQRENLKITADYDLNINLLFDDNTESFFTTSDRSMIVNYILEQADYEENSNYRGISKLLELGVYKAAYPPHQGCMKDETQERKQLYNKLKKCNTLLFNLPIDAIKNYFGIKIALYFTWVEFYFYMLRYATVAGIISIIYSIITINQDSFLNEICNFNQTFTKCLLCNKICRSLSIKDACNFYKIKYFIDNHGTYIFAFFTSIWSALFMKLWKRYSADILDKWGVKDFSSYEESKIQNKSLFENSSTTCSSIFYRCKLCGNTVLLILILFLYGILATFIIFIFQFIVDLSFSSHINLILPPIFNVILIATLKYGYKNTALYLTNEEFHETHVRYENSLQLKMYLLEFVNYYVPIMCAIIFNRPKYSKYVFGGVDSALGGYIIEICLQVTLYMLLEEPIVKLIKKTLWPRICRLINKVKYCNDFYKNEPSWIQDIYLNSWDTQLSEEYLKFVIQYGFITIFASAFPMGPICALITNLIHERHLRGRDFLKYYKRPVAYRVSSIGIWYNIIKLISQFSIITNACFIAFSTNFIPMIYYKYSHVTSDGFLNHRLSSISNTGSCDYSKKHTDDSEYWKILTMKLFFIVLYQNIVLHIASFIEWLIPDTTVKLEQKINMENKIVSNILLKHSTLKIASYKRAGRRTRVCFKILRKYRAKNLKQTPVIRHKTKHIRLQK